MPAIIIINHYCGTNDFAPKGIIEGKIDNIFIINLLLILCIYGCAKASLFPFHSWLPIAMVASYPVSALLHAVAVVKVGLFAIYKIMIYIFGLEFLHGLFIENNWIIYIAIFTIIYSSALALKQETIKKMLAYSTISQLGFALMGMFIFSSKALIAAIMHMLTHSFSKITLFYSAGNIYTLTRRNKTEEMRGVGYITPKSFLFFTVASLSLIGIPPFAGFVSKYYIMHAAAAERPVNYIVIITVIISSLLTAIYLFRVIYLGYYKTGEEENTLKESNNKLPLGMLFATSICAVFSVGFVVFNRAIMQFIELIY